MAEYEDYNSIESAISCALDQIGKSGFTVKAKQKEAICNVGAGQGVFAVLPTGFGKIHTGTRSLSETPQISYRSIWQPLTIYVELLLIPVSVT